MTVDLPDMEILMTAGLPRRDHQGMVILAREATLMTVDLLDMVILMTAEP